MKFSHSIQFNAVPDWSSQYISYSNLKKLIYSLEKRQISISKDGQHSTAKPGSGPDNDPEALAPLIPDDPDEVDRVFTRALDTEVEKITRFYRVKEEELLVEVQGLLHDVSEYKDMFQDGNGKRRKGSTASVADRRDSNAVGGGMENSLQSLESVREEDEEDGRKDSDEETINERSRLQRQISTASSQSHTNRQDPMRQSMASLAESAKDDDDYIPGGYHDESITLKRRTIVLYTSLCELKSFIQLNQTGFSKVLKKYDKTLDRNLKSAYVKSKVDRAYPFLASTLARVSEQITEMEKVYADVVTRKNIEKARKELRLHLREHVVWERNTVWREMIGIERKAQAATLGLRQTVLGRETDPRKARLLGDEPEQMTTDVDTPIGRYKCPRFLFSSTFLTLVAIILLFIILLTIPIMEQPEQQNCFALVVFVSLLWATEAIPLFVTSLLVPFFAVLLRVVRSENKPHRRLDTKQAASFVFSAMWSSVIMLLLGGFTIAAALSKYNIAKVMATFVLSKAGTRPRTVILTSMFVAMFASMWISNVAAPVLCFSIIQPILRNLAPDSSTSRALLLGIALASNIGGAASPIASPQNLIALQHMHPQPGWFVWFFISLPICIICILLIWLLLLLTFRPNSNIVPIRPMKDRFTPIQWFISIITLITIILWCLSHQLDSVFGDMGVIAIIPLAIFFGTGILTKEDFNNFLWTIIILAAGGLALGKAVNSSGLLHVVAESITSQTKDVGVFGVLVICTALIMVVATFISHTVAALIILPLVERVGEGMTQPHPRLLVMGACLMASAAMGLPTSGFPSMTAIMMEDPQTGQRYLQVRHFLTRGIPATIMCFFVIITLGYGLMTVVGF